MIMTSASAQILPEDVDAELDRLYALKLEPEATASLQEICDIIDSLMSEGEHPFASDQIMRHINEYLSETYGRGEYDTLLMAAYRAGLYTDESTAKEIFRHALTFIGQVGFIRSERKLLDLSESELMRTSEGRRRLRLFADFNLRETEMVVQTADWIFAADVITNEQYVEVIRKIFVERLDFLDPSAFNHTIYDFLDDEEYYQLRHGVTEERLEAVYIKVRSSHVYVSETRELAQALAQARAGAKVTLPKAEAEDAADEEPTVEESSLGIDYRSNGKGGQFGEKEGWVTGADPMPKNDEENIIEMISCDETETEKTITKVGYSNSQLGGGTKRGGSIQIMIASEEGNADGGRKEGEGVEGDIDQRSGGLMREMGSFNGLMAGSILTIVIFMFMNWLTGTISSATTLDAKEDCLLRSYGYFWKLSGLVGIIFLAAVTVLSRNETVSVKSSQENRITKFACVHRGRKNFSFLLRIAFYFLLADNDSVQALQWESPPLSYFEWTTKDTLGTNLDYKDYCATDSFFGGGNHRYSCLCKRDNEFTSPSYNNKYSYFICNNDCDSSSPIKIEGFCAQCKAGQFFGHVFTAGIYDDNSDTNVVCPGHEEKRCACSITPQSSDGSNKKWYFEYVCNHSAKLNDHPTQYVKYASFPTSYLNEERYKAKCSLCPAGTYSEQGDMVCRQCERGTYASKEGMPKCEACPPGQYSDGKGYTYCKVCPVGYYSNEGEGQYGSTHCDKCDEGKYADSPGSSKCEECPAGHYTNKATGADACTPASAGEYVGKTNEDSYPHLYQYKCPIGSYSPIPGQSQCTSCPPNTSTYDTGSTSPSDCFPCPYGVDPHTFACLTTPLDNNICWNVGQVLSMGASSAVADLYELVYNLKNVGISALISDAMSVIQGAAQGTSSINDIQTVLDKLKNAPENWLSGLSDNFDSCVASKSNEMITEANENQYYGTNLFEYQFGEDNAEARTDWIAQWQCKGATFGCTSFNTTGCPQAQSCFTPLYKYFAPILSYGGGSFFGNYQNLSTGRDTPEFSPSFIAEQLVNNVESLVQYENAAKSFRRYKELMKKIDDNTDDIYAFTADAFDAVLQVQNVSTSLTLNSSYTEGNLYYEQAVNNYNKAFELAQIVQWGPAFCPEGYNVTAEKGIPPECTDYETLVQECNRDIFWDTALNVLTDTMKLFAGLVQPLPDKQELETARTLFKSFNAVANLVTGSTDLLAAGYYHSPWDPKTEMPTLPPPPDGSDAEDKYADGCYEWYLEGQTSLSDSLKVWSPARWDAIYLENEKTFGPTLLNPPPCDRSGLMIAALTDYLANVKSVTNYGSSMTAAEMSLVPVMGKIATGIATQLAITNANEEISGMVHKPIPDLNDTAHSGFQDVYQEVFYKDFLYDTYKNISQTILAHSPTASLVQQQYIAAKSIHEFCLSYSYMNAGLDYEDIDDNGNKANCKVFGDFYLPTDATFKDAIDSFVDEPPSSDTDSLFSKAPSLVGKVSNAIICFAANVQGNPRAVGQTRNQVENIQTFTLEFAYDPNATTTYYGNLTDGKIRFTLTPSSSLLLKGLTPFGVSDANPRVVNVQTYWRGVTSPPPYNQRMKTTITPIGPYMVYLHDSGEGITFTLPPYSSAGTPSSLDSVYFARFESIQRQAPCATGVTSVDTTWKNNQVLQFCTPYSSDLKQPFLGISSYAFLFPAMWATWEVEADQDQWNNRVIYDIDENELALQVVFQYVASSTASPKGPNDCAQKCVSSYMSDDGTFVKPPLPGEAWCGRNSCSDCPAFHSYNGTQLVTGQFCRCNVWDGSDGTCIPSETTTNTFSLEFKSTNTNLRRQLKKRKKGNDDETEETGKSAKAGKTEMMSDVAVSLAELLQTYLEHCDGNIVDGVIFGNALVQIGKCTKGKKKRVTCDFHLAIPYYEDETESVTNKEQANSCIIATLQESDAIKEALKEFGICDATVSMYGDDGNKEEMIAEWNWCSPFD